MFNFRLITDLLQYIDRDPTRTRCRCPTLSGGRGQCGPQRVSWESLGGNRSESAAVREGFQYHGAVHEVCQGDQIGFRIPRLLQQR